MKFIFTLSFFILSFVSFTQDSSLSKKRMPLNIRLRCVATVTDDKPLIIVNGHVRNYEDLNSLKADEIESITILKDEEAMTIYGCRAARGVILITMKKAADDCIQVCDVSNGEAIAGATVEVTDHKTNKTKRVITDAQGYFSRHGLVHGVSYSISVSSVGYKSVSTVYRNGKDTTAKLLLERDVKTCNEIVVIAFGYRRTGCATGCCGVSRCFIHLTDTTVTNTKMAAARIYPNPVSSGGFINIELHDGDETAMTVRLLTAGGQLLQSQSCQALKQGRITVQLSAAYTRGIYFVQLTDKNGKPVRTDKLMIQ